LTIDIDNLIKQYDADGSGEIEYDEFKAMLDG
jgi:Ca2+-binding EF-hand superfamily protein